MTRVIYQHPLAYLLGLEGLALLRAMTSRATSSSTSRSRSCAKSSTSCRSASPSMPRAAPVGTPVPRLARPQSGRRRHVAGDAAVARRRVPRAEFHEADLHELPLADDSADLVLCALALTHVRRAGGVRPRPPAERSYVQTWHRLTSEYLAAALPLGLQVRRCVEPTRPTPLLRDDATYVYDDEPPPAYIRGNPPDIWALHQFCVAATNAAFQGNPVGIIWHFQLCPAPRS